MPVQMPEADQVFRLKAGVRKFGGNGLWSPLFPPPPVIPAKAGTQAMNIALAAPGSPLSRG